MCTYVGPKILGDTGAPTPWHLRPHCPKIKYSHETFLVHGSYIVWPDSLPDATIYSLGCYHEIQTQVRWVRVHLSYITANW